MAFSINCYGLDGNGNANEAIESTDIYVYFIAQSYSVDSGDTFSLGGFSDEVKFTANPADGYVFTRWVYRVGSATGTVKYSYDNPFTYDGTQDIYIRAEGKEEGSGEPDEPTWTLVTATIRDTSEVFNDNFESEEYEVYRYRVNFEESGRASFYTKGDLDTYGLLTTTTGFDEIDGFPTGTTLAEDDESGEGSNFKFTYDVEADTNYYVWVRCCFGSDSGTIDFYVEPPGTSSPTIEKWSWTSSNGGASSTQTRNAYNAVVNKTAVTNFSHIVWNDMVDKVKDIMDEAVGWWDGTYATYSNTRFNASPYELTADMFNSLRNNIEIAGNSYLGLGYKTGIDKVNSGDKVYGDYFLTLADYINDCIDNL